ncbi:MAG: hypothetical protein WD512_14670, partial [Candidatus Paceibacterota bacterium]
MYEDIRSAKLQEILAPLLDHYYGQYTWIYCGILEVNHSRLTKNTHRFRIHSQTNEFIENHLNPNNSHTNKISQDISYLISANFPDTKWYHNFGTDLVNNPYSLFTDNTTHDLFIDLSFSNLNIYQNDQAT